MNNPPNGKREKTTKENIETRFWEKVKKTDSCWEWIGFKSKRLGHGQFQTIEKVDYAHRFSWILHNGEIPEGKYVLHLCDNGSCVNPEHLFLGTQRDNIMDMYRKNRSNRASFKKDDVIKIKNEYVPRKITQSYLANKYNVDRYTIGRIVRNESYAFYE